MSKKLVVFLLLLVIAVGFIGYGLFTSRVKGISGIKINSTPVASIFLNEQLIGKTPYENKYPNGEYTVKLIPEDAGPDATSWQGKIKLAPSLLTYINRDLGTSELMSGGEILTLEKLDGSEGQISVVSVPEGGIVLLDGHEKGVTPIVLRDVLPGEHDVAVQSIGFVARTVRVNVTPGYKIVVTMQLPVLSEPVVETASPSASRTDGQDVGIGTQSTVLISDTPTGFLRVRSNPSTSASESAQVKPGEKFPLLDEQDGWYKIQYEEGKEGWISGRYAEKIES